MSTGRSITIKRVAAAALLAIALVQAIPSLADVITGSTQESSELALTPTPSDSPSAVAPQEDGATSSPSPSPSVTPSAQATIIYLESESATPAPTYAKTQNVKIRIPAKFPVDPRATSLHISPISISGGDVLLVCMSVDNATLQLQASDDSLLVEGNGSKTLRISGDGAAVNQLLNSGRGLRLIATSRINGAVVTTRAASLTAPSVDSELCAGAERLFTSVISGMGLGLNVIKNPVSIK